MISIFGFFGTPPWRRWRKGDELYHCPMTDEERFSLAERTNTIPHPPGWNPCSAEQMHQQAYELTQKAKARRAEKRARRKGATK